ncbi:MAG: methyltransferase domain-containing protein, partial [Cyanothece sp. SIO2G6]|nr:methyltransferase domain-containing protein [Cyanothece sp. SIO2G6]
TDLPWINWQDVESVLDIGCGYGRLLDFLTFRKSYKGEYWGIDIMLDFVEKAIRTYASRSPEPKAQFIVGDFLEQTFEKNRFDVVISIGGLGVNCDYPSPFGEKSIEYAQRLISKIVSLSGTAISLYFPNVDNIDVAKRKPRMAYYQTSEIEAMLLDACGKRCKEMTFVSYPDKNNVKTIALVKLSKDNGRSLF